MKNWLLLTSWVIVTPKPAGVKEAAFARRAYHGHCMAIVQAGTRPGWGHLTVTAAGLKPATLSFRTR